MSKVKKFPPERCYNCEKEDTITEGISDLERVEVEIEDYTDNEETFMPLCPECIKKFENGELEGIEEKWKTEENKKKYIPTLGETVEWLPAGEFSSQDNLNSVYEEMVEYIKSCGLRVFPSVSSKHNLSEELPNVMVWNPEKGDWKAFVEMAKEENVKMIIVEIMKGYYYHADDIGSITLAWTKDGMIYTFKEYTVWSIPSREEAEAPLREDYRTQLSGEEVEAPEWLKKVTPVELALEMSEFKKKEYPEEKVRFWRIRDNFWEIKGFDNIESFPSKITSKIYKANELAQRIIDKEEIDREKKRKIEEKKELPSLVDKCVDWARTNGLKRLALADVDTFIMENDLKLLYETQRAIYTMANAKLKR